MRIAADDSRFVHLSGMRPLHVRLDAAAFLGKSIQEGLAVRRVAWYAAGQEWLRCIELWHCQPAGEFHIIDLLAWYSHARASNAYRYDVAEDGSVRECPIPSKWNWNELWQLKPEVLPDRGLLYAREGGIWEARLP